MSISYCQKCKDIAKPCLTCSMLLETNKLILALPRGVQDLVLILE